MLNQLIEILEIAQQSTGLGRANKIKEFQEIVWNDETIQDESLNDILTDIAYILDFYEPNKEWRKEDLSYYGDERLEQELKSAIAKLEKYEEASD